VFVACGPRCSQHARKRTTVSLSCCEGTHQATAIVGEVRPPRPHHAALDEPFGDLFGEDHQHVSGKKSRNGVMAERRSRLTTCADVGSFGRLFNSSQIEGKRTKTRLGSGHQSPIGARCQQAGVDLKHFGAGCERAPQRRCPRERETLTHWFGQSRGLRSGITDACMGLHSACPLAPNDVLTQHIQGCWYVYKTPYWHFGPTVQPCTEASLA